MFKDYNPDQEELLPQSIMEFLGEGHEAVLLNELVNELDIEDLIQEYHQEGQGRPAYHPQMMLKVLFYGYMNQVFSSRKLAKKLRSDLGFMYVAGKNQPDFRTINMFRRKRGKILEKIFVQIVMKAKDLGMIEFGTVSLDGTKIYANASKTRNADVEGIEKKMKKVFDEAEKIDALEDEKYGKEENGIPEELKTKEGRKKRRKELKEKEEVLKKKKEQVMKAIEKKQEAGIKQTRINETDEDSRMMQMKKKDYGNGYNPQNVTENRVILSTTVPNSANDSKELIPAIERLKERYGVVPDKILADKGYGTEENYRYLEKEGVEGYVPHPKEQGVDLKDFEYNEEKDEYKDKEGNVYKFQQYVDSINPRKQGRPRKDEVRKPEDFKAKQYRAEMKDGTRKYMKISMKKREVYERNDERLYSDEGKEIYKKRSGCVENVFGNIKQNLGFTRFLLRGFEGVKIEWNLICLAHNMKKIFKFQAL